MPDRVILAMPRLRYREKEHQPFSPTDAKGARHYLIK